MAQKSEILAQIRAIIDELHATSMLPRFCDLSQIGPLHAASIYSNHDSTAIIRENVQCGMDLDQDLAILKALVEYIERCAISDGMANNIPACLTKRSDGFAGFPVAIRGCALAKSIARQNALAEAIERFSWATWWDNSKIAYDVWKNDSIRLESTCSAILADISKILPIKATYLICPLSSAHTYEVCIFFLVLENGGVVSGGAGFHKSERRNGTLRALGELGRHIQAGVHILNGRTPTTFYERRLHSMVVNNGEERLNRRLRIEGSERIDFPSLKYDLEIPHRFSSIVAVHRCYFEAQPDFIGGELERLCL